MKDYEGVDAFFLESNSFWEEFQDEYQDDTQEYFFISKIENFFIRVSQLIQKNFQGDNSSKYCIVSDNYHSKLFQIITMIWEPI